MSFSENLVSKFCLDNFKSILEVEKDVTEEKKIEEGTEQQDNSSTDTSSSNEVKKINL